MKEKALARKRKKTNRLSMFLVGFFILIFCGILVIQIRDMNEQRMELKKQEQVLNTQLKEQQQRSKDLENERKYVTTLKYIEEAAEKLGYVYPDQFILKPEDK